MKNFTTNDDSEKTFRRERYFKVEKLWAEICAQLAYHQQEAEIMRLKREALEPELMALRDEFLPEDLP